MNRVLKAVFVVGIVVIVRDYPVEPTVPYVFSDCQLCRRIGAGILIISGYPIASETGSTSVVVLRVLHRILINIIATLVRIVLKDRLVDDSLVVPLGIDGISIVVKVADGTPMLVLG